MTLDEAIKRFNNNAEYERSHGSLQGCMEFRQLAEWLVELKRLKEQTEFCEDCISRQAVLDGLARIAKAKAKSDPQKAMMGRSMFFIERLPSVQPEPFINKPCVSEQACHEDKMKVLEKIKTEMQDIMIVSQDEERMYQQIKAIIDKYTAESEGKE